MKKSACGKIKKTIALIGGIVALLCGFSYETVVNPGHTETIAVQAEDTFSLADVPTYHGKAAVAVNGNTPFFTEREKKNKKSFESYQKMDAYGRCKTAYANVSRDTMPTGERGEIGQIRPSGWHTVKYNGVVDGNYLYNRCHLIAYCLTAENANEKNLITGTRYLNTQGMLPYEMRVADYVTETGNHVLYRVTPVFGGKNLVASGVLMEAYSVEDKGEGISFCVYCYNVQPGVVIDYRTGDSRLASADTKGQTQQSSAKRAQSAVSAAKTDSRQTYILNMNTKKFHRPNCRFVKRMNNRNRKKCTDTRKQIIKDGYEPCKVCKP